MPLQLITPPAVEPVTLDEAKNHLRVDVDDDDLLITTMIAAARQQAEAACCRQLITADWRLGLDRFPAPHMDMMSSNWYGPSWGTGPGPLTVTKPDGQTGYEIEIPLPTLQEILAVKYIDENGVQQTLDPSQYIVDSMSEPAKIVPAYSTSWPATRQQPNAVTIEFRAGYGDDPASVPQGIKAWMLIQITTMYENRESVFVGPRMFELSFVDRLLDPFRVQRFV